jgi:hypothetical protein
VLKIRNIAKLRNVSSNFVAAEIETIKTQENCSIYSKEKRKAVVQIAMKKT